MKTYLPMVACLVLLAACGSSSDAPPSSDPTPAEPTPGGKADDVAPGKLEVRFLGVGGFLVRYGGDSIMTPPMYSNPNLFEATAGKTVARPDLVDRFTEGVPLGGVSAILVGHAHYDHLMDVPYLWPKTDNAKIYGNRTMRHLMAAYAPDRAPHCAGTPETDVKIPRDRVVQLDDPLDIGEDYVDYRNCMDLYNGDGDGRGAWVNVEGSNVRFRALCSHHPDQFGNFHFGEGAIGADMCTPPERAEDWREGLTLTYIIDFLDPETREPRFRLFYQDAPTEAPLGHVPEDILAEKSVDMALLCVGNFNQVPDQPGAILRNLEPRYSIGGHWEDFFRTQDKPLAPLPFLDIKKYEESALQALGTRSEAPVMVDGQPDSKRHWLPAPGTKFVVSPEDAASVP